MTKGVTQSIENETKRFGFCSMLLGTPGAILLKGLGFTYAVSYTRCYSTKRFAFYSRLVGTLGAILLRNLLSGKGVVRAGNVIRKSGNRIKKKRFLILLCSLTNPEISGTHWIAFLWEW